MNRRWRMVCRQLFVIWCFTKVMLFVIYDVIPPQHGLSPTENIDYSDGVRPRNPLTAVRNWTSIFSDVYVYSLHIHPLSRSLRFVLALNLSVAFHRELVCQCLFHTPHLLIRKPAVLRASPDHHDYDGKTIGAGIFSCALPRLQTTGHEVELQCRRSALDINLASVTFPVPASPPLPPPHSMQNNPTIVHCGAPIHSAYSDVAQLIEFVEYHRSLGVSGFVWYVYNTSLEVENVLQWYSSQGIVYPIRWNVPVDLASIHYFGQAVALNDCLLRVAGFYDYTITLDFDELVWLRSPEDSLASLLISNTPKTHDYVLLRSVRTAVVRQPEPPYACANRTVKPFNELRRTTQVGSSRSRTKYMVRTLLADNAGIHSLEGSTLSLYAPHPGQAVLFHLTSDLALLNDSVEVNTGSLDLNTLNVQVRKVCELLN